MSWDKFRLYFLICALLYAFCASLLNFFLAAFSVIAKSDGWKGYIARTAGYFVVSIIMLLFVLKFK